MSTPKRNAKEVDCLICPSCASSIFRLIRDPVKEEEWAICLECDGYTIVKHLEDNPDTYDQRMTTKP